MGDHRLVRRVTHRAYTGISALGRNPSKSHKIPQNKKGQNRPIRRGLGIPDDADHHPGAEPAVETISKGELADLSGAQER